MPVSFPNYPEMAVHYAREVAAGRVPACKLHILACKRFLDMRDKALRGKAPYYFSAMAVCDVADFVEGCPHTAAFEGNIVLEPFQCFLLAAIYGFRSRKTRRRWVTQASLYMPRKNAKSALSAPLALFAANCEGEVGASVVISAGSEKQAQKVFMPCRRILQMTPEMKFQFGANDKRDEIVFTKTGGEIRTLATRAENNDGENPSMVIAEELHAQDFANIAVLRTAQGAREAPLFLSLSTAGRSPDGPAYNDWLTCIAVLEGRITADRLFCFIATVDKEDESDPYDPLVIAKANPMLGASLREEKVEEEVREARQSESSRVEYLRTRLNVWSRAGGRMIELDKWDACSDPTLDVELLRDFKLFVGGDLASRNDLNAATFLTEVDGVLCVTTRFWIPEGSKRFTDDRFSDDFHRWATTGPQGKWTPDGPGRPWLKVTPGGFIDYRVILEDITSLVSGFRQVAGIGLDDYQANLMAADIERLGHQSFIVPKTAKILTLPTNDMIARIGDRARFLHDGNPLARWCAGNVVGHWDLNDNVLPRKETKDSKSSIDGFDSLVVANAIRLESHAGTLGARAGGAKIASTVYNRRGLAGSDDE